MRTTKLVLHLPGVGFVTNDSPEGFQYGKLHNAVAFDTSGDVVEALTARARNYGEFSLSLMKVTHVPTPMGAVARVIVEEL